MTIWGNYDYSNDVLVRWFATKRENICFDNDVVDDANDSDADVFLYGDADDDVECLLLLMQMMVEMLVMFLDAKMGQITDDG